MYYPFGYIFYLVFFIVIIIYITYFLRMIKIKKRESIKEKKKMFILISSILSIVYPAFLIFDRINTNQTFSVLFFFRIVCFIFFAFIPVLYTIAIKNK